MELYKIFKSTVLTEGRKEDVMAKYPDAPKEIVEHFSQNDPSGNNKYLEWMVVHYLDGETSEGYVTQILEVVSNYHSKLNLINKNTLQEFINESGENVNDIDRIAKNPKDINSFDFESLKIFADFLSTVTSKKQEINQMKKESDRIYEDKELLVLSPKTHKASCHYGVHSTWCVATANTGHFTNYTKSGTLYFFISKIDKAYNQYWNDRENANPPYKTALLLKDNGDISWWSKNDTNYTDGWVGDPLLPMLTPEIAERVLAHNKTVIETRKQREIERVLLSSGFYQKSGGDSSLKNDFGGFVRSKIFSPEQIVSIIRNDNWLILFENSEIGKSIRSLLGPNTVFALLREMITGQISMSQFEILKDLHSQEFLSTYGLEMSDDQNREIANIVIKKLGKKPSSAEAGGDVKMYIDKWTMTPEDWDKYNSSSNYFFIGDNIEELKKVDRFNPKDHHAIQMMMLGSRYKKDALFAVVTEKDLVDEYIGLPSSEIPENVKSMLRSKARKIKVAQQ